MAVSQAVIKAELLAVFQAMKSSEYTEDQYADELATVIVNAITSAEAQLGIAVQVNPATGAGSTTANGVII